MKNLFRLIIWVFTATALALPGDFNLDRHGFRDRNRDYKKKEGVFRIVVLGDSFVWGDGIAHKDRWSVVLEELLKKKYGENNIEVLHWGKCGWSTKDELSFLKREGIKYDIDLLIIGWVDNDCDMGNYQQIPEDYLKKAEHMRDTQPDEYYRQCQKYYNTWFNKLYKKENLKDYSKLILELKAHLRERGLDTLIVFTPNDHTNWLHYNWVYSKIIPILEKARLSYLNLHPLIKDDLKKYDSSELRVSEYNGHPNRIVTKVFARHVYEYLTKRNCIEEGK